MVDLKIYITGRRRRKLKERQLLAVRFSNNFQSVGTVKGYCQTKRSPERSIENCSTVYSFEFLLNQRIRQFHRVRYDAASSWAAIFYPNDHQDARKQGELKKPLEWPARVGFPTSSFIHFSIFKGNCFMQFCTLIWTVFLKSFLPFVYLT